MMPGYIPDTGRYEAARRGINDRFSQDATINAYGRFLSQQRGNRQLSDMSRGFQRSFPGYQSQFARRGLARPGVQSGSMQQSMQRYIGDHYRDYGRTQQDLTQGLQQFDLDQARMNAWRQSSLADLDLQQSQEIARAASNLEALRQYYGGL